MSLSELFFVKSSQNSHIQCTVLTLLDSIPCVFCVYTSSKDFSHYDLSVQSMSVMGFQNKSLDRVWPGGVSFIQFFWGVLAFS